MAYREQTVLDLIDEDVKALKRYAIIAVVGFFVAIFLTATINAYLGLDTFQLKSKDTVVPSTAASNVSVGRFKGYLNTWDVLNLNGWRTRKGAFEESFKEHAKFERANGKTGTGIPILFNHRWDLPIGVFTVIKEDAHGVYVEGEINLNTRQGADVFSLMKQGALTSMSISFYELETEKTEVCTPVKSIKKKECKIIEEVVLKGDVFEGSVVTFPADRNARIEVVQ